MKIRAQIGMVLNLDKCIGCHTCSVTCKNVWTSREGVEYAWFNNVETKPGVGYPNDWENQKKWKGGWAVKNRSGKDSKLVPKQGGKLTLLAKIFANPNMPQIDDYYEPFTYNYEHLQNSPKTKGPTPVAKPQSVLTGKEMSIKAGPNWEEILGGEFSKRGKDYNFYKMQKEIYGQFANTFMMYLPRLCEHCLNPACVASCPSGALYKREEDGIVLLDQERCRGWRMCVSGCPYKKIYYNWKSGKSEKCLFCYPRIESGEPTVCAETCVGRIRSLGVILYDADRIKEAASVKNPKDLYEAQLKIFLDPHDEKIQEEARKQGIKESWLQAAKQSPVYKMAMDWKVALPLHPEYRTLPMVWYIPPLSPIQPHIQDKEMIPKVEQLRIPIKYLANLLTAGDEKPIVIALKRMLAMRMYMRSVNINKGNGATNRDGDVSILEENGLDVDTALDMYKTMALANYEDRFVVPTHHTEFNSEKDDFDARLAFEQRVNAGFTFGDENWGDSKAPKFFGDSKPQHGFSGAMKLSQHSKKNNTDD